MSDVVERAQAVIKGGAIPGRVLLRDLAAEVVRLRAREQAVRELLAEYRADDERHLAQFGQHHPVAGIAADHLAAVLDGEQQ